jgi:CRP-like cAMP-binding protein
MVVRQLVESGVLSGEPEQHEAGKCLFRAGEKVEYFMFILSGSVWLTAAADAWMPVMVSQNSLLGLPDLMNENYTQSALVLDTTSLVRIRRSDLLDVIRQDPQLRVHLLKQLSRQTTLTKPVFE